MKMPSFKKFISEAIPLSTYRNEILHNISSGYKDRYKDWFDGKWRIYIPLSTQTVSALKLDVNKKLSEQDYEIHDWKAGLAKSKVSNKHQRIGKILSSLGEDELLKKFNERFSGKKVSDDKEYTMVISRHPYDIAGQSFDREWDSCKNFIDGCNKQFVTTEIEKGALIAYVISPEDNNIKNPIARILMVPLNSIQDEEDVKLFAIPQVYGKHVEGFKEELQQWLDSKQGTYELGDYGVDIENIYDGDFQGTVTALNQLGKLADAIADRYPNFKFTVREKGVLRGYHERLYPLDSMFFDDERPDGLDALYSGVMRNDYLVEANSTFKYHDIGDKFNYNESIKQEIFNIYVSAGGNLPIDSKEDELLDDIAEVCEQFTEDIMLWYDENMIDRRIEVMKTIIERYLDELNVFHISGTTLYLKVEDGDEIIYNLTSAFDSGSPLHDYFPNGFNALNDMESTHDEELYIDDIHILDWINKNRSKYE